MRPADELRDAVEAYLGALSLAHEAPAASRSRFDTRSRAERIRPVLCLAVADAAGGAVERALPAAAAVELVHTFSLVHDDLQPSTTTQSGAGDRALTWPLARGWRSWPRRSLVEAHRLAPAPTHGRCS